MLQSQWLLHDTYVYGVDAKRIIPTLIYPTEIMDGAIVSANCVSACDKNTTFHHLNNPVIHELYNAHGKDLNFTGVIITNENIYLSDKERSSHMVANLASFIGIEGAVISKEGFSNPDTDLMMICAKLQEQGIKTVLITDEYAGKDGSCQSLADANVKADAVISVGNANEIIKLSRLNKIIGNIKNANTIAGASDRSFENDEFVEVELQAITGATNELGFGNLSAIKI